MTLAQQLNALKGAEQQARFNRYMQKERSFKSDVLQQLYDYVRGLNRHYTLYDVRTMIILVEKIYDQMPDTIQRKAMAIEFEYTILKYGLYENEIPDTRC